MTRDEKQSVGVAGDHNKNVGNHHQTTNNYTGLTREDLIAMMEERFHLMLKKEEVITDKEEQVKLIFEENRKLTDEVIRQNADFRIYNAAYARQAERIAELNKRVAELTDMLLKRD